MATHPPNPNVRLGDGDFFADDPHTHFRWMRENAPVFHDPSSGYWGIALYDDVMAVSKDPQTYSNAQGSRPDYGPLSHMIDRDDPAELRRIRGLEPTRPGRADLAGAQHVHGNAAGLAIRVRNPDDGDRHRPVPGQLDFGRDRDRRLRGRGLDQRDRQRAGGDDDPQSRGAGRPAHSDDLLS